MSSISVLMSVYRKDNSKFLNDALNSVWDLQTLKPKEIILIQDGKLTSELDFIVKKWKNKLGEKLILVENSDNIGLTKSLNRGIEFCSGDYIARMDADDLSSPNRFKLQTEFFKLNAEVDILGGSMNEFNENDSSINIRSYPKSTTMLLKQICKSSPLCHPSVMFRKKVFDDGNRYNEKYTTTQDLAFWFELLKKGYNISNLDDILINFRINQDFAKRRSLNKAIDEFKIYIKGVFSLFGFSLKLIFPIMRLVFRLMPPFFITLIYRSRLRAFFLNKKIN